MHWRDDEQLRGRLHAEYPDDLQVIVHDGNPRRSGHAPEAVWAPIVDSAGDHYVAVCLNRPQAVTAVGEGDTFRFRVSSTADLPFLVTNQYLADRAEWVVVPCGQCGFDELFDAPSELAAAFAAQSPDGTIVELFTQFCPLCGGVQTIGSREAMEHWDDE